MRTSLEHDAQGLSPVEGRSPAIFKCIPRGGCHTSAQLRRQLRLYVREASYIFDASGRLDDRTSLTPDEIKDVAQRFEESYWCDMRHPKLGYTTHLFMSFPIGATLRQVVGVSRFICYEFFQGDGAHFDHIVAVHHDHPHPRVHILLNRQNPMGEVFHLRKGGPYSYEAFRAAMVRYGDPLGLRLEASLRAERDDEFEAEAHAGT